MVVIRLARGGTTKRPKYRVTVSDQRRAATGRYIEILGHYNPRPEGQDKEIELKLDRVEHWISHGAQPTNRVKSLIKKLKNLDSYL